MLNVLSNQVKAKSIVTWFTEPFPSLANGRVLFGFEICLYSCRIPIIAWFKVTTDIGKPLNANVKRALPQLKMSAVHSPNSIK